MNPWTQHYGDFHALMEAEEKIVRERVPVAFCVGYVTYSESGDFGCWLEDVSSESLGARLELLFTKSGIALGCPEETLPRDYWLQRLFLLLRENGSAHISMDTGGRAFIQHLIEACVQYCLQLERQWLESIRDSAATQADSLYIEESIEELSTRRSAVVIPILKSKRWTRGRWATEAGVGKNSVYGYLCGKRKLGAANRQAMAEVLGLTPEELPK